MTSSQPNTPNSTAGEGGGLLPALLAGAGILLVAGLFIFGGDDEEKTASGAKDQKSATTAQAAKGRTGSAGGVSARPTDDANKTSRPQPRLNPRIANAIVTEGMSPSPNKKPEPPTSFSSTADEIAYWEQELRSAESNLQIRETAAERAPATEAQIREHGSAEDLAQFQKRLEVVADNLEQAKARVAEVEAKLAELRGG